MPCRPKGNLAISCCLRSSTPSSWNVSRPACAARRRTWYAPRCRTCAASAPGKSRHGNGNARRSFPMREPTSACAPCSTTSRALLQRGRAERKAPPELLVVAEISPHARLLFRGVEVDHKRRVAHCLGGEHGDMGYIAPHAGEALLQLAILRPLS